MLRYHGQLGHAGLEALLSSGGDEVEDLLGRSGQPLLLANSRHLLVEEPRLEEGGVSGGPQDGAHVLRRPQLPRLVGEVDPSHGSDVIDVVIGR